MNTPVTEAIRLRRSVRAYTGEALNPEHKELLEKYIAALKSPFADTARIQPAYS
jgi:hypothetical protein